MPGNLRLDQLVVAGAGGLLCPGSPDVLGDFGHLIEDVVDDDHELGVVGERLLQDLIKSWDSAISAL